jgi:anaphase-promoting complex subunit 4
MSVFGVLPCGRIDVAKSLKAAPDQFHILDVKMSVDFRSIFVIVRQRNKLKMLTYENETIPNHAFPLLNLAAKHGHILNTMAYIEDIIQCITEAWETELLEMDNKLTKYAVTQPEGAVSADFLELLMFGYPSTSLQRFLTR